MEAPLQERVLAFVSEQTGVKPERIRPATTLSRDLGIEGDDAVEFFERFHTKFAVDLQELGRVPRRTGLDGRGDDLLWGAAGETVTVAQFEHCATADQVLEVPGPGAAGWYRHVPELAGAAVRKVASAWASAVAAASVSL